MTQFTNLDNEKKSTIHVHIMFLYVQVNGIKIEHGQANAML